MRQLIIVFIGLVLLFPVQGQSDTIISLGIPESRNEDLFTVAIDEFEAANPGVRVALHKVGLHDLFFEPTDFEAGQRFVTNADVLLVSENQIQATRSGLFLDLAPIAAVDLDWNAYYPVVRDVFAWDGGLWALPAGFNPQLLVYRPDAFDAAGLPYPGPNWTITDFANAARTVGMYRVNEHVLLDSLYGGSLQDALGQPQLLDAAPVLDEWAALIREGAVFDQAGMIGPDTPDQPPLRIADVGWLSSDGWAGALLSGGAIGVDAVGYAVSGGTAYPETAYQLAKFLSQRNPGEQFPAYQSAPEIQALIEPALFAPPVDSHYTNALDDALDRMLSDNVDARFALESVQLELTDALQLAETRRGQMTRLVDSPRLRDVGPGEIRLRFGVATTMAPLPNQRDWDEAAAVFAAADPVVGDVLIEPIFSYDSLNYDCLIAPSDVLSRDQLLPVGPYMDADVAFDPNDLLPGVLSQLTHDNLVWGYPLMVRPDVLVYNVDKLAAAGVPYPANGWTPNMFIDTLMQLASAYPGELPYGGFINSSTHIMKLIAAFGGLPLDFRTDPVTVNFTDPVTVDAIRQVLDLAKNGLMGYLHLADKARLVQNEQTHINPARLSLTTQWASTENINGFVAYPQGSGISYGLTAGYILNGAPDPDACYRWIAHVSRDPRLNPSMPASHSMIHALETQTVHGPDIVQIYTEFEALMSDPDTVIFPPLRPVETVLQFELNAAFDNYVLGDADLETELAYAERVAQKFLACVAQAGVEACVGPTAWGR